MSTYSPGDSNIFKCSLSHVQKENMLTWSHVHGILHMGKWTYFTRVKNHGLMLYFLYRSYSSHSLFMRCICTVASCLLTVLKTSLLLWSRQRRFIFDTPGRRSALSRWSSVGYCGACQRMSITDLRHTSISSPQPMATWDSIMIKYSYQPGVNAKARYQMSLFRQAIQIRITCLYTVCMRYQEICTITHKHTPLVISLHFAPPLRPLSPLYPAIHHHSAFPQLAGFLFPPDWRAPLHCLCTASHPPSWCLDTQMDRCVDGWQGQRRGGFAAPPLRLCDIERPPTPVITALANRLPLHSATSHVWIALSLTVFCVP